MTDSFNPLDHPIAFRQPRFLVPSGWNEHVPFAMALVDILRPRVLAEIGRSDGAAYCAFCEAVLALGLDTRCRTFIRWQGSGQPGGEVTQIPEELRAHHDVLYGHFSKLLERAPAEGIPEFADGSIDLLHMDGYQGHEATKHDFEEWLPKLSGRGVVLIHGTEATAEGGPGRLWADLKARYPCFEFTHGGGLGVLAVGTDPPLPLRALLHAPAEEAAGIRDLFASLGRRVHLEAVQERQRQGTHQVERLRQRLGASETELAAVRQFVETRDAAYAAQLRAKADEIAQVREELRGIHLSLGWRILEKYRRRRQSSRLLAFGHRLVAVLLGWIRAGRRRRVRANAEQGSVRPELLFLPGPQPQQAARELESLRGRFPGHALSVVAASGMVPSFGNGADEIDVRVYQRPQGRLWRAGLRLVTNLRERTFDVVALPWQPAFEGARSTLSLAFALLLKARNRVVLGPDLAPRPLRRRMVAAALFDLLAFFLGLPIARLGTRLPLLLARTAGKPPRPRRDDQAGALAILIPILPDLSHTFVYREVLQVLSRLRGQRRVVVVALEEGSYQPLHPEARALLAHSVFVPAPSLAGYVRIYLRYLVTRPLRLARLIRLLAPEGRPDPSMFLRLENLHGLHPSKGLSLARLLEREGVSYIHCYGTSYPATRAITAARLLGVPFSFSTFVDFDYEYPFKCLPQKVSDARFVVACTRYCKERLVTLTEPSRAEKIHVIHHSLDPGYGATRGEGDTSLQPARRADLFAASRLVAKKGFDYLLQACALLRDRGVDVRLRLMGDGEEGPRLKAMAAELGLDDRVWFAGSVPNDRIWELVGPEDVCVLPCVYCGDGERDGIPVILLEALSREHAVISTRVSGIPELIEDGVHGLLVPERDPEALADAIERAVTDGELRRQMARAGRERVKREFNLEDKANELMRLIALAGGPAPPVAAAALSAGGNSGDPRPAKAKSSVSIVFVNHNGARYVEPLFESLGRQTYPASEVWLFDNGSTDGSDRMVEERYPWVQVVRFGRNTGYSYPVNEGIRRSTGDYVLVLNVDVLLTNTFVEELVSVLDRDPAAGWVAGKVLKLRETGPTEDIDCLGHHMSRNRYARERDYSRPFAWSDYAENRLVFGASACAALYRRAMLEDVRLADEYFDEDFFAYFEDVDVDWRAQQRGWKCVYTPRAVAYHVRGGTGLIRQRKIAACYLANRWLMLVKNDEPGHLLQDARPFLAQLVRDLGRTARQDPLVLPIALGRFVRNLPRMVAKRQAIKSRRMVPRAYLRTLIR